MKAGLAVGVGVMIVAISVPIVSADKLKDVTKILGTWTYVSGEEDGKKVDPEKLKKQTVTITKDTMTLKGTETFVLKYSLDNKNDPATIKMEITKGPEGTVGSKSRGILELKDDELRICYATEGGKTPTKFETKEGSKAHLFVLKRKAK